MAFVLLICGVSTASAQWESHFTTTLSDIRSTCFVNAQTGWAVGNSASITKTINGGSNWIYQTGITGSTLYRVYFADENTGFACGTGVFKTTDGGTSWDTVSFTPVAVSFGMKFINSNTGWVCSVGGKINKTTNGGLNWNAQTSGTISNLTSIDFTDENTGWICGNNGVILKTTNGGTNWTALNSGTTSILNNLSFSNSSTGMAAGDNNTLLKTTNGGNNWSSIGSLPSGRPYNALFWMPNTSMIWTSSLGVGIFCSTDNGTSWSQQNSASRIYNIGFSSDLTGYAGDDSGKVFITKTGGFNLLAPVIYDFYTYSTSQIYMEWIEDNVTEEDKFMLEKSTDSLNWVTFDSTNGGDYGGLFGGLTSATKYYFRVFRKKMIFSGGYSDVRSTYTFMSGTTTLKSPINDSLVFTISPKLSWTSFSSATSYRVEMYTHPSFSGLTYSANVTDTFCTVPNGILQSGVRYYWRVKCYNGNLESDYATYKYFITRQSNYGSNQQSGNNLYYFANSSSGADLAPSKPNYNWRDTTGSINLIVNQTGTPSYGNLDNGSFVLTNVFGGNKARFFGSDFTTVNVSTNGYVSFLPGDLIGWPVEPPSGGLPVTGMVNFIAPFWADLYYEAPGFPSRLCYKVTGDELIITYSKAIMYDLGHIPNVNMCISFQLIIRHEPSPVVNSNIEVMYNYDETGWYFIDSYNANMLRTHLIGLQAGNTTAQTLTYRYQNSAQQFTYGGPIFGSNLALGLSPSSNLLPIELSSFTSQINGGNVKLEWSTVNEQNNSGFDVERKLSGSNDWKKISFVQGNGTTNQTKNYSYEDR
ncbi:MAG: hypothetical protein J0M18_20555, partial [Ignavibacteria bacterium]|nr:hypothetical protein [Ignavibacteria bacterium]